MTPGVARSRAASEAGTVTPDGVPLWGVVTGKSAVDNPVTRMFRPAVPPVAKA